MNIITIAEDFATEKHKGQFRFDGVTPYIEHPKEVARRVAESVDRDGMKEEATVVAWCHDLLEDTDTTIDEFYSLGFSNIMVWAIETITKKEDQSYKDYLEEVIRNPITRKVKIHDMLANLSDSPSKKQVKKYADGLTFLLNGII